MEVRAAVPADAEAVAALAGQLGYETAGADVEARLEALAADDTAAVLVAVDGGSVIGWIHVHDSLLLQAAPFAEVGGLVVDGDRRGDAVGERLLRAAEAWASERGHREVRVRSNVVRRRAHGFYERLGYRVHKSSLTFHREL